MAELHASLLGPLRVVALVVALVVAAAVPRALAVPLCNQPYVSGIRHVIADEVNHEPYSAEAMIAGNTYV